jgi:type VI secretion system protein ImpL
LSYRWGLYVGDNIYPHVRSIYFTEFRQLLFGQTQTALVQSLRDLPATPGPDYGTTYDTLKAYLITTSNSDKSVKSFLSPVLQKRWAADRDIDPERMQLAHKQFDFYSDELRYQNPYSNTNDGYAVTKARKYLAQFAGPERVYRAMLAEAAKASPSVEFNTKFPGSAAVLLDSREVSGAFTKAGWNFMSNAIRNPEQYFAGEQWVLGDQTNANIDPARLEQQLSQRYLADMTGEWRAYLKAATFLRYASIADAAHKLNLIAGNQSPLLELLSLASQNTAVKDNTIASTFQPVQTVVPPKDDQQLISPANQNYMRGLLTLQSSVEQLSTQNPPSDAGVAQVLTDAASAKVITRQMAQGFRPDPVGHVDVLVQTLMEDPITHVEALLKVLGPAQLNGNGKGLCAQIRSLWLTYPFNPNAGTDASEAQVNAIFRKPDGAIWTFYDQNLQKLLLSQGLQYIQNPTAQTKVTPAFLHFFNTAAAASNLLYAGGAQDPKFTYTLTPVASEGIEQLGLTIDGQTLTYSGGTLSPKTFTWQAGGPHDVKATVRIGNGPDLTWAAYQGTWAAFRFFDRAEQWQRNGTKYDLAWTIRIGNSAATLPSGKPLTVRFDLDMGGAPAILQRGYFSGITCTADVAR